MPSVADKDDVAVYEGVIEVYDIGVIGTVTVTRHVSDFPPSAVVTVIAAVPTVIPVTRPLEVTVATEVLLEVHVTFWFAWLDGNTTAIN